jgi:23S rRNA pseudouridine1911/1915/1917 synthase
VKTVNFLVSENEQNIRLDKLVSLHIEGISRSYAASLIEAGLVTVMSKVARDLPAGAAPQKNDKKDTFPENTEIEVTIPDNTEIAAKPQNIPLDIVFEDEHLLVVNKPKGMVVHPAPGNPDNTLVNALLFHCGSSLSGINGEIRPGIVHRIDKDTAGLLIVAKNDETHKALSEMIKAHNFTREYEAVIIGNLKSDSGVIEEAIGRSKLNRKKMCVRAGGRNAETSYSVIARFKGFTHVRLRLKTGRTHQIRVHMAYIGHPVLGDSVYGKADKLCKGQCLYAKHIAFSHPVTGEYLSFESELPDWFSDVLRKIS